MSVIVAALTLASQMAGFGRPMCLSLGLEQSLGKIAQAKERKYKHTTFNCIHLVDDWLQSHPSKKIVEYHQSQFHRQPP